MLKSNIPVNPYMDKLFRRMESGESVNYSTFGKEIFKQVELNETQNPMYLRSITPTNNSFKIYSDVKIGSP